ncbi:MAG: heavy-metal-associated domain-containing protein [Verrucomicrobiota bacterium]
MEKVLILIVVGFLSSLTFTEARTWTQAATGKTLEGELTRVNGEKILITRSNGSSLEIPIAMLADEDKQFIAEWQKEKSAAPPLGGDAPAAMEIPEGETELVLADVHMICNGSKNAIEGALGSLTGATISTGRSDVTIEADTGDLAKTAMEYLMQRGFYGEPSIEAFADTKEYSDEKKESLTVSRLPLYCGRCVGEVEGVLKGVDGLEEIEGLSRGARDVTVKGEVSQADVMAALHKAGMHAQVR